MRSLSAAALRPSTTATYKRSWQIFNMFSDQIHLSLAERQIPLTPQIVALFVAYLFENSYRPPTIRTHLSAIAYSHRMQGHDSPTDSFLVQKLMKGVALQSPGGDARYPITLSILRRILGIINHIIPSTYMRSLLKAMCTTAFFGFLRCGEMCLSAHTIQIDQLQMDMTQAAITMHSFKHNSDKSPFVIRLESKPGQLECPIFHLQNYIQLRKFRPGPLFADIDGTPISRNKFSSQLNLCLRALNLDITHYKAHSFRIGAASHALMQGKSDSEIRILGRWSSTAFRGYLRVAGLQSI